MKELFDKHNNTKLILRFKRLRKWNVAHLRFYTKDNGFIEGIWSKRI